MAFADYDFAKHQGITASTAKALQKRFQSWEALADTPPEVLMDVRGVDDKIALDLIDAAKAQIRLSATRKPQGERIVDMDVEGPRRLILSAKNADFVGPDGAGRLTCIKRRRKVITPAVCDKCGMDFVEKTGAKDYDACSPATQQDLRSRVAAHKEMVHPLENELILTEDQMENIRGDADPTPEEKAARRAKAKPRARQQQEAAA